MIIRGKLHGIGSINATRCDASTRVPASFGSQSCGLPPAGREEVPIIAKLKRTTNAALQSGLIERRVLLSVNQALHLTRSTFRQFSPNNSPRDLGWYIYPKYPAFTAVRLPPAYLQFLEVVDLAITD